MAKGQTRLDEYLRLFRRLLVLGRKGQGDGPRAAAIRERMTPLWDGLSARDKQRFHAAVARSGRGT